MKNVSPINESKDIVTKAQTDALDVRVQNLENQASTIFVSVGDEFADVSKIEVNNNVMVDGGSLRIKPVNYTDTFTSIDYVDQTQTSSTLTFSNGVAKLYTGTVGYDPDAVTNNYNESVLVSEAFSYGTNVTQFNLTPEFATPTGIVGFSSPLPNTPDLGTILNTGYFVSHKASNGTIYQVGYTGSSTLKLSNGSTLTTIATDALEVLLGTVTAYSNKRNIAITSDTEFLYVAYPITNFYSIKKIRMSDNVVIATMNTTTNTTMRAIDICVYGSRLHVIWSVADATPNRTFYNFCNLASFGTWFGSDLLLYSSTTFVTWTLKFVPIPSSNYLGWAGFLGVTTTGMVRFGILDVTSTNATNGYSFRTTPVSSSTNSTGTISLAVAGGGNGTMVYDSSTGFFYIMSVSSGYNQIQTIKIGNGATSTGQNATNISTAPFNSVSNRGFYAIIENTSNVHVFYANTGRTTLTYAKLSYASGSPVYVASSTISLENGTEIFPTSIIETSTSPFYYNIYSVNSDSGVNLFTYNVQQPELYGRVGNANFEKLTSLTTKTFTVSSTNAPVVSFQFRYPINKTSYSGTNYSVELTQYTLSQLTPTPTYPEGYFQSKSLLSDRPITKIVLEVDQTIGGSGNNIEWYVQGKSGQSKIVNAGNGWTATFSGIEIGSSLKVEAYLNNATTPANIQSARINGYKVNVFNVVTSQELLPIQVNIMKLGLQTSTLLTSNRTSFTNMMIDLFSDGTGVTGMTVSGGVITGTGTVTSVAENTDNNIFPTQIIVVEDFATSTSGVVYEVKRNGGQWETVTPNTNYSFIYGTIQTTNTIQIRANLTSATLAGWAYLYA